MGELIGFHSAIDFVIHTASGIIAKYGAVAGLLGVSGWVVDGGIETTHSSYYTIRRMAIATGCVVAAGALITSSTGRSVMMNAASNSA